jgi:hypothetical protein
MEIDYINENAEGAIVLDGFNDAIIGIVEEFGNGPRVLYSKQKIIDILCKDMESDDAEEYYNFNILGLYAGEQNAIFLVSE